MDVANEHRSHRAIWAARIAMIILVLLLGVAVFANLANNTGSVLTSGTIGALVELRRPSPSEFR